MARKKRTSQKKASSLSSTFLITNIMLTLFMGAGLYFLFQKSQTLETQTKSITPSKTKNVATLKDISSLNASNKMISDLNKLKLSKADMTEILQLKAEIQHEKQKVIHSATKKYSQALERQDLPNDKAASDYALSQNNPLTGEVFQAPDAELRQAKARIQKMIDLQSIKRTNVQHTSSDNNTNKLTLSELIENTQDRTN
ncbi:MAG: hypothetical protein V3V09_08910 [Arenicellales bacterium]